MIEMFKREDGKCDLIFSNGNIITLSVEEMVDLEVFFIKRAKEADLVSCLECMFEDKNISLDFFMSLIKDSDFDSYVEDFEEYTVPSGESEYSALKVMFSDLSVYKITSNKDTVDEQIDYTVLSKENYCYFLDLLKERTFKEEEHIIPCEEGNIDLFFVSEISEERPIIK